MSEGVEEKQRGSVEKVRRGGAEEDCPGGEELQSVKPPCCSCGVEITSH